MPPEIWFIALLLETIQISGKRNVGVSKVNAFSKCFIFMGVAANQRYVSCEKNWRRNLDYIITVHYLHVTLFKMHVGDTAAEKEFDTAIQMALEHLLF